MTTLRHSNHYLARFVFDTTKLSLVWLLARVYIGFIWVEAGIEKVIDPAWTGDSAGSAVRGFVNGALQKTGGAHPDVSLWYAAFLKGFVLPNAEIFSYLVVWGELLIGIALILGILTGLSAFFGVFMNFSFLLSGAVSVNPIMVIIGLPLVLAWRVAGYWGLDRYILPKLPRFPTKRKF